MICIDIVSNPLLILCISGVSKETKLWFFDQWQ